ncbi:hypothetical protein ACSS6W_007213 [Trichoderma asperelloides]|uniref:Clock-controlled pheromone ccg-4 n=1 Tax=Trichoderma asperellum TaxID=101201 RepID=A0A6V8QYT0_TRIAP|nr:hypothetical protein LI328DRAFT_124917 [Trichoderma asperelloides]GFP57911.1 clock-controlled pheromone ccg-4 [Trichoderma asperellum]
MKFLTAITLFATAAIAAPNPEPWCWRVGESCWKAKRANDVFNIAVRAVGGLESGLEARSEPVGGIPNDVAFEAIKGIENLAILVAQASNDPKAFFGNHTEPAKRDLQEEEKRWCWRVGESCWKAKRTDEIQEDKRWCWRVGESCWKAKRVAEALLDATIEGDEKRSVETEDSPAKRWCWRVGESCWKAKRNIEFIQDQARSLIESLQ